MTARRQDENAILSSRRLASHATPLIKKSTGALSLARKGKVNVDKSEDALTKSRTTVPRNTDRVPDEKSRTATAAAGTGMRTPLTSVPVSGTTTREKPALLSKVASVAALEEKTKSSKPAVAQLNPLVSRSKLQEPTIPSQSRSRAAHRPTKTKLTMTSASASTMRPVRPPSFTSTGSKPKSFKKLNDKGERERVRRRVEDEYEVEYMPPPVNELTYAPDHLLPPAMDDIDLALDRPGLMPDLSLSLDVDIGGPVPYEEQGDQHAADDSFVLTTASPGRDEIEPTLSIADRGDSDDFALNL
ncbi:hypothetical protein I316_04701 [Kwoniella heveanensis BCC8398]|uniref:Securin n=1 Tax=Kwoniella heveanensis BCC8398 TaxID=1296120 RepID=A0A1B9GRK9_9TREE|nr:hypothetical protein I316_04701 [Kwoniella heveanensis BCC8398]